MENGTINHFESETEHQTQKPYPMNSENAI